MATNCAFCGETGEMRGVMFSTTDRSVSICCECVGTLHRQMVTIAEIDAERIAAERDGKRLN